MGVTRIVPYLESSDFDAVKSFYVGLLGLTVAMEDPEFPAFLGLRSEENRSAQIVVSAPGAEEPKAVLGVDVGDAATVDAIHARARTSGLDIVYPLTDEPWGIRRFFVRDPTGAVVSVLAHLP